MDHHEKEHRKRQAWYRLRAQRQRAGELRGRVVVISLITFALLWGIVFAQMATGNDPVLSRSSSASATAARRRAKAKAAKAAQTESGARTDAEVEAEIEAEEKGFAAEEPGESEFVEEEPVGTEAAPTEAAPEEPAPVAEPEPAPEPVITGQS